MRRVAEAAARLRSWPVAVIRFLIGRDIFISYARADGDAYAQALANAVAARRPGVSFYLDQRAAPPTPEMPSSLIRHLQWSRMLVLVCTKAAACSPNVRREIGLFIDSPRPLVPIDVDHGATTLDLNQEPWRHISGGCWVTETFAQDSAPVPSDTVIDRIVESVKFADHETRLRRILAGASVAIVAALD